MDFFAPRASCSSRHRLLMLLLPLLLSEKRRTMTGGGGEASCNRLRGVTRKKTTAAE
jgi:hypothetical protein